MTYHPPETPAEVAAEMDARAAREAAVRPAVEAELAALKRKATEWTGAPGEGRARFGCAPESPTKTRPRTLILNCPRCGAEVEFRVDSADVTVAAQTVAGRVHLLRADVDLTGGHTCEVEA